MSSNGRHMRIHLKTETKCEEDTLSRVCVCVCVCVCMCVCVYGSKVGHNVSKVSRCHVNTVKTGIYFEHGKLSGVYIAADWNTI